MSTKNTKAEQIPCACCSIFFNSKICPQCAVAGCSSTIGTKQHKCRLQGNLMAVMQLTEFQVRHELAELRTKYQDLLEEAQRLVRVAHTSGDLQALDAAGVDPGSQRGKLSMLAGAH